MSILSSSKAGKASIKIDFQWLIKYGFVKAPYESKYKYKGREFQYLNYTHWIKWGSGNETIEKYHFSLNTSSGISYFIDLNTLEDLDLLISFFEAQNKKQKNEVQIIRDKLIKKATSIERPTEMFNWTYQKSVSSMADAISEKVNKQLCKEIEKRYVNIK